jgi:hypothetical protein
MNSKSSDVPVSAGEGSKMAASEPRDSLRRLTDCTAITAPTNWVTLYGANSATNPPTWTHYRSTITKYTLADFSGNTPEATCGAMTYSISSTITDADTGTVTDGSQYVKNQSGDPKEIVVDFELH